jgi:uncharacterized protein (DUF1778 family)
MDTLLPEPEQTSTHTTDERLWTANDLARYIGCSVREIRNLRYAGLPTIKFRHLIRFDRGHEFHELAERGHAVLPVQDRGHEFAGHAGAADRAIVLRPPRHAVELGRGHNRAVRLAQPASDLNATVVVAHLNPASGGDDCFQLDSEEHAGGFGIRFFHNPLVLSRAAALSPSVLITIFCSILFSPNELAWFLTRPVFRGHRPLGSPETSEIGALPWPHHQCVDIVCLPCFIPDMSMATASARIDLRLDRHKKSVVARAAELAGVNITQFIMDRVFPDAERIVLENNRIRLSGGDWTKFCARLDAPPKKLPELRKLLQEPSLFKKA